jgi:ABC-type branched-subunit amino acid transport system ATPase component
VEQHMDYALALSDEVLLLRQGEVTFRGPPSELDRRSASLLSESLPKNSPPKDDS